MRIELLVPGPMGTISGGYAYDRAMAAGLAELGHDVETIELAGHFPLADEIASAAARTAWREMAPDVVPVIDGLALPAFDAGELGERRAVGLIHHPTALETGRGDAERERLRAIERDLMPRLATIVVTSQSTAERLAAEFGVAAERIRIVTPGTADAPRSEGSGGATCEVLTIGTLVPRKGHDILIRALARLFDLDWHLTIVGDAVRDPVHAARLSALVEECGVCARVTFAGEADPSALQALWARADMFALATHYEGYGMAIAEALKRGVPVVVTSGGAAGALVTADSGMVCPPGDVDQLSKAMRRLIFDRSLRTDMAAAAWDVGATLPNWQTQARSFAAALES